MGTVLKHINYCYFWINLLLLQQGKKSGKKHSFNKWDLPNFDKALLSSLTAAATYEGVRLFFLFSNITAEHLAQKKNKKATVKSRDSWACDG